MKNRLASEEPNGHISHSVAKPVNTAFYHSCMLCVFEQRLSARLGNIGYRQDVSNSAPTPPLPLPRPSDHIILLVNLSLAGWPGTIWAYTNDVCFNKLTSQSSKIILVIPRTETSLLKHHTHTETYAVLNSFQCTASTFISLVRKLTPYVNSSRHSHTQHSKLWMCNVHESKLTQSTIFVFKCIASNNKNVNA